MLELPDLLAGWLVRTRGEAGAAVGEQLLERVRLFAGRWQLEVVDAIRPGGHNALAVDVISAAGTCCVLKLPVVETDGAREAALLRYFNAGGAPVPAVYAVDDETGAMLIERADPGTTTQELPATLEQVAALFGRLERLPAPDNIELEPIGRWLDNQAASTQHGHSDLVPAAIARGQALLATMPASHLLHGDVWGANILWHRGSLVAIDPQGKLGEAPFELGAWAVKAISYPGKPGANIRELAGLIGEDEDRCFAWAQVHAGLWERVVVERGQHERAVQLRELALQPSPYDR